MTEMNKRQVLICGGGPSGLAAAIMLHQQGWEEIILVERRVSHDTFERGKAFNYQLDGRGQNMLSHIGIHEDDITKYGIANRKFILNSFGPDGIEKSFAIPFVLPGKKTAYWITRSALLDMLYQRLSRINSDERIKLYYGHQFDGLEISDKGALANIVDVNGQKRSFKPSLILGCDGVNSQLRTSLAGLDSMSPSDFTVVSSPSPSSNLMYKVIKLPRKMSVSGNAEAVNDHKKSYVFTSTYKELYRRISLFSLPVARPKEQRSANIILPLDHDFWKIQSPDEVLAFLKTGFPQLDINDVFPRDEVRDFIALKPGKFPDPQYSPKVRAEIRTDNSMTYCVLLGDSAHAFPPDLGLGVNSALEDVFFLGQEFNKPGANLADATSRYEETRLPESRALVRLVKTVFPYQYNHVPWRLKLSLFKFFVQVGINKITGGLIAQPGFRLSQDHRPSYTEMERRIVIADLIYYFLIFTLVAALLFFASRFV